MEPDARRENTMAVVIRNIRVICTAPEGINLVVVKVETSEPGLYGLGCATFSYRHLTVRHLIETYLAPLLEGQDVRNITELWQLMHQNAYWRCGPIVNNAISGIDMALWDIKGKMAGMPVYDLFGGKVRAGVPIYRHVDGADLDEICEGIERYREAGVRYIRCQRGGYGGTGFGRAPAWAARGARPGIYLDSGAYMRDTVKLFEGIRQREGFDIDLIHDVHERIHPTQAMGFVKEMEPYKLFFMEDVVPLEHIGWLEKIRERSTVPLSQGELFNNPAEYQKLVEKRTIDYMRVHISQIGGITPARKLQLYCEQYGVRICWHGPGDMSPIAHAANIHIDLAAQNLGIQEWSGIKPPNSILQEIKGPQGALLDVFPGMPEYGNDGYVYASERPGLGVELGEREAAKYPCENSVTLWTQTRNADGSLQAP